MTNYNMIIERDGYVGYAITNENNEVVDIEAWYNTGAICDWEPVDMNSEYMIKELWELGGWSDEDEFMVDCHCEGYGRENSTGWVENILKARIPSNLWERLHIT